MTKNSHINLGNARVAEQRQVMKKILAEDHCPFCSENFSTYHSQPLIKETKFWMLTTNQWPYANTQLHLLAVYKPHATTLAELEPQAGAELIELLQWAEREFEVPGGGWAMRFGDTDYSAGTINHLHVQFLVPDIDNPSFAEQPVRLKIGKPRK